MVRGRDGEERGDEGRGGDRRRMKEGNRVVN